MAFRPQPIPGPRGPQGIPGSSGLTGQYDVTLYGIATTNTAVQNATALTTLLSTIAAAGGGDVWFPPSTSTYKISNLKD